MNRVDKAEGTALAMASLCVTMIAEDPELIERLRREAVDSGSPFEAEVINARMLELIDLALMTMAMRALEGKSQASAVMRDHAGHDHETLVIPMPNIEDGAGHFNRDRALAEIDVRSSQIDRRLCSPFTRPIESFPAGFDQSKGFLESALLAIDRSQQDRQARDPDDGRMILEVATLTVKPVRSFQRFLFIYLYKRIQIIEALYSFEVIQYSIPAKEGVLVQGFLIIMYG